MTPILRSVIVQGLGSAASVLASVLVAWRFGLASQGEFALLRTWSDAWTAVLCLGVPQGLLHLTYREGVPAAALNAFVLRFTAVVMLVASAVAVSAASGLLVLPLPGESVILVAVALPFWVTQLLWRALALRSRGLLPYAALTALPATLVLLGVVLAASVGRSDRYAWLLLVAALLSAAMSAWVVRAGARAHVAWSRRTMWSVSLQTWMQGLAAAWMSAVLLSAVALRGATMTEVGLASLALQLYQLFAVAAAYAAPPLYDSQARVDVVRPLNVMARFARRIGWVGLTGMLGFALLVPWAASRAWPAVEGHETTLAAMALAGLLALVARMWSTLLQAAGRIRELSWQAAARLVFATTLTTWWTPGIGAALAVALALVLTELLSILQMAAFDRAVRT